MPQRVHRPREGAFDQFDTMGSIGIGEIILLAGIALVIIGPEKFPEFARIIVRTFRDLRGYVDDLKRDIADELRPVTDEVRQLSHYDPETYIDALSQEVGDKPNVVTPPPKSGQATAKRQTAPVDAEPDKGHTD